MLPPQAQSFFAGDRTAAFFSGRDGVIEHWTPWAQELLGYAAGEIEGKRVDVLIPPEYHDAHWAGYDRAIAAGRFLDPSGATLPVVAKGGAQVPLAFFGRIVRAADGSVAGIVSSLNVPFDPALGPFYERSGSPLHGVDIEQVVAPAARSPAKTRFHVRRSFEYREPGTEVVVPEGFVTDLASVPWFVWWLVASYGRHTAAAIVHDVLIDSDSTLADRKLADGLFFRALKAGGGSWFRRRVMWLGVSVGGTLAAYKLWLAAVYFVYLATFWFAVFGGIVDRRALYVALGLLVAGYAWRFAPSAGRPYRRWLWPLGAGAFLIVAPPVLLVALSSAVIWLADLPHAVAEWRRTHHWRWPGAGPTFGPRV